MSALRSGLLALCLCGALSAPALAQDSHPASPRDKEIKKRYEAYLAFLKRIKMSAEDFEEFKRKIAIDKGGFFEDALDDENLLAVVRVKGQLNAKATHSNPPWVLLVVEESLRGQFPKEMTVLWRPRPPAFAGMKRPDTSEWKVEGPKIGSKWIIRIDGGEAHTSFALDRSQRQPYEADYVKELKESIKTYSYPSMSRVPGVNHNPKERYFREIVSLAANHNRSILAVVEVEALLSEGSFEAPAKVKLKQLDASLGALKIADSVLWSPAPRLKDSQAAESPKPGSKWIVIWGPDQILERLPAGFRWRHEGSLYKDRLKMIQGARRDAKASRKRRMPRIPKPIKKEPPEEKDKPGG